MRYSLKSLLLILPFLAATTGWAQTGTTIYGDAADGNDISTLSCTGDPLECTHSADGVDTTFTLTDVTAVAMAIAGDMLTTSVTEDGNTITSAPVDLSPYLDNTDVTANNLALSGNVLGATAVEGGTNITGTTVDLTPYLDNTDVSGVSAALTGTILEVCVTEAPSGPVCDTQDLASIDTDTDVSAVSTALGGTILTTTVTENGGNVSDTVDLAAIDTDISTVDLAIAGQDVTVSVTEDGVTLSDTITLPSSADTNVSAVAIAPGPNDAPDAPTFQVEVTEDGTVVTSNEYAFPLCDAPMTRSALRSLRTAGNLRKDCHYVITDYNRGTVGVASILLHAVDADTLSMDASVKTAFDSLAWEGRYDIDAGRLIQLNDNLGNEVTEESSVDTFPWGVTTVTDNRVLGGRLTYTAGTVNGNLIGHNSTLNMIAGTLNESQIVGDSDVTIRTGTNYEINVDNSSYINQVGTGHIRRTSVTNNSTVTIGDTNMKDNRITRSTFNSTGSTGSVDYNIFEDSNIVVTNVTSLTLSTNTVTANSQFSVDGAARTYVRYTTMSGYGRIIQSAGTSLDANYNGLRDYSYIVVSNGTLFSSYTSLANISYLQHNSTGTNRVDSLNVSSRSNVRFLGTSTGNRIYYSEVTSGSTIYTNGSATGCYFYYSEVTSSSNMYANNSVDCRFYYNSVQGNSELSSNNMTGVHYAHYNVASAHGYLRHANGSGGYFYAIHASAQALITMTGGAGSSRLYYSSFTGYYYLTALNWTVTRYALHGYGRRSYTVTNPAANGTFTQNF